MPKFVTNYIVIYEVCILICIHLQHISHPKQTYNAVRKKTEESKQFKQCDWYIDRHKNNTYCKIDDNTNAAFCECQIGCRKKT